MIDKVNMLTINYYFIEFKVLYRGTNRKFKTGDVINVKTSIGEEKVTNEDIKAIPSDEYSVERSYCTLILQCH